MIITILAAASTAGYFGVKTSIDIDFNARVLQALQQEINSSASFLEKPCSYLIGVLGSYYYMANGSNGQITFFSTNASAVINNAYGNGSVFIKDGTYSITTGVLMNIAGKSIRGESQFGTILSTGANAIDVFTVSADNCSVSYLTILGQLGMAGNHYGFITTSSFGDFGYLTFKNIDYTAFEMWSPASFNTVHNIQVDTTGEHGIEDNDNANPGVGGHNTIESCIVNHAGDTGIQVFNGANYDIVRGNTVNNAGQDGYSLNSAWYNIWSDNNGFGAGNAVFYLSSEVGTCAYNTLSNSVLVNGTNFDLSVDAWGTYDVWGNQLTNFVCRNVTGSAKSCVSLSTEPSSTAKVKDNTFTSLTIDTTAAIDSNGALDINTVNCTRNTFNAGAIINNGGGVAEVSVVGGYNRFIGMEFVNLTNWGLKIISGALSTEVRNCQFNNTVINNLESSTMWSGNTFNGKPFENYVSGSNSTDTTIVINHGLASTANYVFCSFNTTAVTGYSWTSTTSQITVTVTGTLPAAFTCYAEVKYVP